MYVYQGKPMKIRYCWQPVFYLQNVGSNQRHVPCLTLRTVLIQLPISCMYETAGTSQIKEKSMWLKGKTENM